MRWRREDGWTVPTPNKTEEGGGVYSTANVLQEMAIDNSLKSVSVIKVQVGTVSARHRPGLCCKT